MRALTPPERIDGPATTDTMVAGPSLFRLSQVLATVRDMASNYDKQDQYDKIQQALLPGEQIVAVYDCTGAGTGFVGVTDRRVVLQDNSFVGKKQAVTSLPYRQIQSISFVSDKSVFGKFTSSSTIAITSGGEVREATFRGDDKARHVHDTILSHIM